MKLYDEKRIVLCDLAELYLDTKKEDNFFVNDGIIHASGLDSISFLMLLSLCYSKEEKPNMYSIDLEIDIEMQKKFIEMEYKKVTSLPNNLEIKGKIILDDAKKYYNDNFDKIDSNSFNKIIDELNDKGIHI